MRNIAMLAALVVAAAATPAAASIVTLDFEGVGDRELLDDFYAGGTDSAGHSGTDYGVSFEGYIGALIDEDAGGKGDFANEPSANTAATIQGGFPPAIMNVQDGFDTGFSLYSTGLALTATVTLYDGLDGSGAALAQLDLVAEPQSCSGDPTGSFCFWSASGVSFSGVARSVVFDVLLDYSFFFLDDITLGSATPGAGDPPPSGAPEPATWATMIAGFGLAGAAIRRRPAPRAQSAKVESPSRH